MLSGLQGSGKTTASAKLARFLERDGKRVLLVGADLQRPAAVEQLRVLGSRIDVPVYSEPADPVTVARDALDEAARLGRNVVIVDTAGRLQIDADLMDELRHVRDGVSPHNSLLVVDAMTGQEAVNVAEAFQDAIGLDGVILTKLDGDARGGAALSVKEVVGRPILFAGVGEKLEDFEAFHPDRMASRILGMGDVLTLIEKAEATFDVAEAEIRDREAPQGSVHARGLPDPDAPGPQDGPPPERDQDAPRRPEGAQERRRRRRGAQPGRGDHLLDDGRGARAPVDHQRVPPDPDRRVGVAPRRRTSMRC